MKKALILLSGGQDSTTCLFWAKSKFDKLIAIGFDYNQRHIIELECAKKICDNEIADNLFTISLINFPSGKGLSAVALIIKSLAVKDFKMGFKKDFSTPVVVVKFYFVVT